MDLQQGRVLGLSKENKVYKVEQQGRVLSLCTRQLPWCNTTMPSPARRRSGSPLTITNDCTPQSEPPFLSSALNLRMTDCLQETPSVPFSTSASVQCWIHYKRILHRGFRSSIHLLALSNPQSGVPQNKILCTGQVTRRRPHLPPRR